MRTVILAGILALAAAPPATAGAYLTKEEALARAFRDTSEVVRSTRVLSPEEVSRVEERARAKLPTRIASYYVGEPREHDGPAGDAPRAGALRYAFFETEIVRTLPALLMICVDGAGQLDFVEILAFHEPEDYLPPAPWLDLYGGRSHAEPWRVGRDIPVISGSTLSVHAVDGAVRRALVLWELIAESAEAEDRAGESAAKRNGERKDARSGKGRSAP
jgi:hypothetical protein